MTANHFYDTPIDGTVTLHDKDRWPAKIAGYWNGWAVPLVTRATAEQIVVFLNEQIDIARAADMGDHGMTHLAFDGDTLVATQLQDDDENYVERIEPNADGLYDVGLGLTWFHIEDVETPQALIDAAMALRHRPIPGGVMTLEPVSIATDGTHRVDVRITHPDRPHGPVVAQALIGPRGATHLLVFN